MALELHVLEWVLAIYCDTKYNAYMHTREIIFWWGEWKLRANKENTHLNISNKLIIYWAEILLKLMNWEIIVAIFFKDAYGYETYNHITFRLQFQT
jgi:hypothetical protein